MDSIRARHIMESHGVIGVSYKGLPVWLEAVDGNNADVTFINTDRKASVPVNELVETNPV